MHELIHGYVIIELLVVNELCLLFDYVIEAKSKGKLKLIIDFRRSTGGLCSTER